MGRQKHCCFLAPSRSLLLATGGRIGSSHRLASADSLRFRLLFGRRIRPVQGRQSVRFGVHFLPLPFVKDAVRQLQNAGPAHLVGLERVLAAAAAAAAAHQEGHDAALVLRGHGGEFAIAIAAVAAIVGIIIFGRLLLHLWLLPLRHLVLDRRLIKGP